MSNEQGGWNRSGDDQFGRGRPGGRFADRDPQLGGRPHDPFRRGVHEGRRAARRPGREAPGRDEPREHDLLDQAVHGPQVLGSRRRSEDGPLQGGRGAQRRRAHRGPGQAVFAARDLGHDPAEAEAVGGGLPRREGHQGGHHRPRLLQRLAAPGHQGRRQDRRPRRPAHRERAHGGRAGLRPRQEEGRDDRRLRLRRRHLRHLHARGRRGRGRGQGHQRRHPPRRRQPRPADHRLDRDRVQEGPGHRPRQGQDGDPAPARGGGEGQDRAQQHGGDGDQPALRHRGRLRSQAPQPEADAGQAGAAGGGPHRQVHPARQAGPQGRQRGAQGHRRGRARRRHDAHAEDPGHRQEVLRQGAAQGRQPRRGRRGRARPSRPASCPAT